MKDDIRKVLNSIEKQGEENAGRLTSLETHYGVLNDDSIKMAKSQEGLKEKFEKFELLNATEHATIKNDTVWIKKLLFIGFGGLGALISLIQLLK